ncbi:hypothetical protein B0T26DRAFT_539879 [Lasiosphaeria miniovina]|uniref:C2H2-type domain-containing protein n=1 Tax=Lasiosphaeria miniovina TaxID=1954250 RepID=A0AA39ZR94_9PEZI|nr:uncharacterized protein B0T26DRAFT_539879 [Lasiosphaeria miniovina]KAK0702069.1 hypothetical protein B0T26DRAFT_539879 [Lasiosphaeria miniovina]
MSDDATGGRQAIAGSEPLRPVLKMKRTGSSYPPSAIARTFRPQAVTRTALASSAFGHSTSPIPIPIPAAAIAAAVAANAASFTTPSRDLLDPVAEPAPARITSDTAAPLETLPPNSAPAQPFPARARRDVSSSENLPPQPRTSKSTAQNAKETERRAALSKALKARWASGAMSDAVRKRQETLKRRQQDLLGLQRVNKHDASSLRPSKPKSSHLNHRSTSWTQTQLSHLFLEKDSKQPSSVRANTIRGESSGYVASDSSPTSDDENLGFTGASMARIPSKRHNDPTSDAVVNGFVMDDSASDDQDWAHENEMSDSSPTDYPGSHGGPAVSDVIKKPAPNAPVEGLMSIEMAAPDRPYKMWRSDDGLALAYGALIPETYELTADPEYPWTCPVRDCQKTFKYVSKLGPHFVSSHRCAMLHDNEDGTFTKVGSYLDTLDGTKNPAIVVSRGSSANSPRFPAPKMPPMDIPRLSLSRGSGAAQDSILDDHDGDTPMLDAADYSHDENAQTLWKYLQGLLVKHKGPRWPQGGYVEKLITLPRVRELEWNAIRSVDHRFLDSKPIDISAMIIQVTGEPAPEPCTKCKNGKGPFLGCVMISSTAHLDAVGTIFACANCFYHFGQIYCSHKVWGAKRAEKIKQKRLSEFDEDMADDDGNGDEGDKIDNGNSEEDDEIDDSNGKEDDEIDDGNSEEDDEIDDGDGEVENIENSNISISPNGLPTSITMAEPNRPYTMWPDGTGNLQPGMGALFPAGYQLDFETAEDRSWICSVRSCRRLFIKRQDLGFHFQRIHFASLLNDNGDGTLSIRGIYRSKKRGVGRGGKIISKAPPFVVSKDALDPNEEPSAPPNGPETSTYVPKYLSDSPVEHNQTTESWNTVVGPIRPPRVDPAGLWESLRPYLTNTRDIPDGGFVRELLQMPQVRDLNMNPYRVPLEYGEKSARDVAAMVIQVTGEAVVKKCKRCRDGKGPFSGCVAIARKTDGEARLQYTSCANCLYHGRSTYCSMKEWVPKRMQPPFPTKRKISSSRGPFLTEEAGLMDTELQSPAGAEGREQSSDRGLSPPCISQSLSNWRGRSTRGSTTEGPRNQNKKAPKSSLISVGAFQSAETLEMETWEIAPGRLNESSSSKPQNIAFSKAYLSTNQAVQVCEDVAVRVETIHSGTALSLAAESRNIRICSVASGKLRVKVGDEPEFIIGPHGIFKVRAGVSCTVQNAMYIDAILHMTVLSGFT